MSTTLTIKIIDDNALQSSLKVDCIWSITGELSKDSMTYKLKFLYFFYVHFAFLCIWLKSFDLKRILLQQTQRVHSYATVNRLKEIYLFPVEFGSGCT